MGGGIEAGFCFTATSGRMGASLPVMASGERLQASGLQYARGTGVGGVVMAAEHRRGKRREKRCVFLNSSCRDDVGNHPCPAGGQQRFFRRLLSFGNLATPFLHKAGEAWTRPV